MIRKLIALFGAVVLIGVFGALYVSYTRPIGLPPTGETLPPRCQISDALRREARVSNPSLVQQPDPTRLELVRHTHCFWRQTINADGIDRRILGIHVYDHDKREDAERTYSDQVQPDPRPVDGLADKASVADRMPDDNMQVTLIALRDTRVFRVIYRGADRGFFFDTPYPVEEGERITRKVVEELLGAAK